MRNAGRPLDVVWTISLLVCCYLSRWIYSLSRMMGVFQVFTCVSSVPLLASIATNLLSLVAGMCVMHLGKAWVAGKVGYALAKHCYQHRNDKQGAGVK